MDCDKAKNLLSDHIGGLTVEDEKKALMAHLGSCAACAGEARLASALKEALRGAPRFAAPEGFASRVMEGVRAEGLDTRKDGAFGWFRAMPLRLKFAEAAAAAFVMALGVYSAGVLSDNFLSARADNAALDQADFSLVASVQPEDLGPVPPESLGDIYLSVKENGNGQ